MEIPHELVAPIKVLQAVRKFGMITDWVLIQYSITAQLSVVDGFDVTRLLATEHLLNKFSLLEYFKLHSVTLLILLKFSTALSQLGIIAVNQSNHS